MTSRSPFTSQGITGYAKFGQTSKKQLVQMITLIMGFVWPKHLINMLQVKFHLHERNRMACSKL
jgi:hypothetical protein